MKPEPFKITALVDGANHEVALISDTCFSFHTDKGIKCGIFASTWEDKPFWTVDGKFVEVSFPDHPHLNGPTHKERWAKFSAYWSTHKLPNGEAFPGFEHCFQ